MKETSKKLFIIAISIITLFIIFSILWHVKLINDVKKYLESKNYNDVFTDIKFIEADQYIEKEEWVGGVTYLDKKGKYYRYKVHAQNANIDFYVQYRTELYKEAINLTKNFRIWKSVAGFENNYMVKAFQNKSILEFQEILGNDVQIQFSKRALAENEKGVLNNWYMGVLEIYPNKTLAESYNEEFLNKLNEICNPKLTVYKDFDEFNTLKKVIIEFNDCQLNLYIFDLEKPEINFWFRYNDRENVTELEANQKMVQDWLYKNNIGYKTYVDKERAANRLKENEYKNLIQKNNNL